MAMSAKERKLSRLGSCKVTSAAGSGGGGGGSPAARGHRSPAAPQRRVFAALFAFLCAGVVVLGGMHVIGGELSFPICLCAFSWRELLDLRWGLGGSPELFCHENRVLGAWWD